MPSGLWYLEWRGDLLPSIPVDKTLGKSPQHVWQLVRELDSVCVTRFGRGGSFHQNTFWQKVEECVVNQSDPLQALTMHLMFNSCQRLSLFEKITPKKQEREYETTKN